MKHSKLLREYSQEMALKNQAYFFILSKNMLNDFRDFCAQYPIDYFIDKTPVETATTCNIENVSRETSDVESEIKENIMNK